MAKTRVGVLRGGPSSEFDVSLKTGGAILSALRDNFSDEYQVIDIFIDQKGIWHIDGIAINPEQAIHRVDVMFNALHGAYGEDGKIQGFLEMHSVPYTGSESLASAVGMNKTMTNQVLARHGIKIPLSREIPSVDIRQNPEALAREIFTSFPIPAVIKPVSGGSSHGVSIVRRHADVAPALLKAAEHDRAVLIQEFISGIEATCGIIENFRNEPLYALPPIEIRPDAEFFDFDAKYKGKSKEIVPATFSHQLKKDLETLSRTVHSALGLRHYSRSDFIIHPRRGIYFLEVNTLPGLTNESLIPKALRAVGGTLHQFADHLIKLAIKLS